MKNCAVIYMNDLFYSSAELLTIYKIKKNQSKSYLKPNRLAICIWEIVPKVIWLKYRRFYLQWY